MACEPIVQMEHESRAARACSRPQLNSMTLHEQLECYNMQVWLANPLYRWSMSQERHVLGSDRISS